MLTKVIIYLVNFLYIWPLNRSEVNLKLKKGMEKIVNINLGAHKFVLEQSAYNLLVSYFDDIRSRLDPIVLTRVMCDLESRIAGEFRSKGLIDGRVATLMDVQRAITVVGVAASFGSVRDGSKSEPARLYRDTRHRFIAGICAGLADYLNVDVTVVRLVALLTVLFVGVGPLVYIIMWIFIPRKPLGEF